MPGCLRSTKRGTLQQSAPGRKSFAGSRTRDSCEISSVKGCNNSRTHSRTRRRIKLLKPRVKSVTFPGNGGRLDSVLLSIFLVSRGQRFLSSPFLFLSVPQVAATSETCKQISFSHYSYTVPYLPRTESRASLHCPVESRYETTSATRSSFSGTLKVYAKVSSITPCVNHFCRLIKSEHTTVLIYSSVDQRRLESADFTLCRWISGYDFG